MTLIERDREDSSDGVNLDQGILLFVHSVERGRIIAEEGLEALRLPDGAPMDFHETDLTGIIIETAALEAGTRVSRSEFDDPVKQSLLVSLRVARKFSWEQLLDGLPMEERLRFAQVANTENYLDHAHQAAAKLLRTSAQEKAYRRRRLRAELPVHFHVMQGIRQGQISFQNLKKFT